MKKIMIISRDFIPYSPAVGSVSRVWYMADYFARLGYLVHIVSSRGVNHGNLGFPLLGENIVVDYIFDPMKYAIQSGTKSLSRDGRLINLNFIKFFLKKLLDFISIPDAGVFSLPFYYFKLRGILKINQTSYDLIIVSAPSHSLFLLVVFLKRFMKGSVKLADYRDGWSVRSNHLNKPHIIRKISKYIEGVCLKNFDLFAFAAETMRNKTVANFPDARLADRSVTVLNGFPDRIYNESSFSIQIPESDIFKVGHFGIVNDFKGSYRNISSILHYLNKIYKGGSNFELHLYGDVRIVSLDLDVFPFLKVFPALSHGDAIKKMSEMNCLLMYHMERNGADEVITGKFFDYVLARRPILCISPQRMEGARLVKDGCFGVTADFESFDEIQSSFFEIYKKPFYLSGDEWRRFGRDAQFEKLLNFISANRKY